MSWKNVVNDFIHRRPSCEGNTASVCAGTAQFLCLHGNIIARSYRRTSERDCMEVSVAGYQTKTTLSRLNALPGVSVVKKKGQLYLNGEPWDGDWGSV